MEDLYVAPESYGLFDAVEMGEWNEHGKWEEYVDKVSL